MKTLLFLTGLSGSGKGYFKENILPKGLFYSLISMTTRNIRENEQNGVDYYFVKESDFKNTKFVTYLDVNKNIRAKNDKKWLYGVSEKEFLENKDKNLIYDVIQPIYIRDMINWCVKNNLIFDFKILYFIQTDDKLNIAKSRANMNKDILVRKLNTCNIDDFKKSNLIPDWKIICSKNKSIYEENMILYINNLSSINNKDKMNISKDVIITSKIDYIK